MIVEFIIFCLFMIGWIVFAKAVASFIIVRYFAMVIPSLIELEYYSMINRPLCV